MKSSGAGRPPVVKIELENFARRLHQAMTAKRLSQSDLARKIWGSTTDKRGYNVAKNRDRISTYLRGEALPDTRNMQALADALGMTTAELAPDISSAAVEAQNPEIQMTAIAGHSEKVYLRLNKMLPLPVAVRIVSLIAEEEGQKAK